MYSVIFVNDIVLTEGCIYIVPYQWESEHILNVFCHSGNIRKAINVFNSKCFIPSTKVAKILRERERQEKTTNGSTFVNCHGENIVNFVQQK